ncbi:hypothetical protein ACLBXM_06605 [Xanthobacteraceae bacterium A53D]
MAVHDLVQFVCWSSRFIISCASGLIRSRPLQGFDQLRDVGLQLLDIDFQGSDGVSALSLKAWSIEVSHGLNNVQDQRCSGASVALIMSDAFVSISANA